MEEKCGICLEVITDAARVDCKHCFCYDCIASWCKVNNSCPLCKSKVTKIYSLIGYCYRYVSNPVIPYEERIHEHLVRRDYQATDRRQSRYAPGEGDNDLVGFVVGDEEIEYDEDDECINARLEPKDFKPISSRTRSRNKH